MVADLLFVFSKLLPPLIYPLGLACLLMAGVWLGGLRRRWQRVAIGLALALLWLASSRVVAYGLVRGLEWRNLPAEVPLVEAIVVLGGGIEPAAPPRPGIELKEAADRLFYAAQLFRDGKAPIVVASGGGIPWDGAERPESSSMAEMLKQLGVSPAAIIEEGRSRNTRENAVETRRLLERRGIRSILLVTSALHMPRALGLFRHEGLEVGPAPTDFLVTQADPWGLRDGSIVAVLLAVLPDPESLSYTTRALKEYLGLALYRLQGLLD